MKKKLGLIPLMIILFSSLVFASPIVRITNFQTIPFANGFTAHVTVSNWGTDMTDFAILELQPQLASGLTYTEFWGQAACDPAYPNNVHRKFMMSSGTSYDVDFVIGEDYPLSPGIYTINALIVNQCCADGPCYVTAGSNLGWGTPVGTVLVEGPAYSYICGNGICELDAGETPLNCNSDCTHYCGDGVCSGLENYQSCLSDCDPPHFDVEIFTAPSVAGRGTEVDISLQIINNGDDGTMKVGVGVYGSNEPWLPIPTLTGVVEGSILVPNCVGTETNVQTKEVTIQGGNTVYEQFTITTPTAPGDFIIFAEAFQNCAFENPYDYGRTSYDTESIELLGDATPPSCNDLVTNQDETDIDCGGTVCNPCQISQRCGDNSDCTTNNCEYDYVAGKKLCSIPGENPILKNLLQYLPYIILGIILVLGIIVLIVGIAKRKGE